MVFKGVNRTSHRIISPEKSCGRNILFTVFFKRSNIIFNLIPCIVFFSSILFHNKKRAVHNIPDRYCMNLSDIIAINICKQGSDNMRIAICDDEVSMVQILEEKIKKLLPDAVIDKYLSGDELIASGSKPDILFLDIQMPGMDGMETAKVLRQDNEDMILIFVTAAEEYVFQAYG